MPYTLLKFLGWGTLLACIGVCIGWALRSLKSRAELARAVGSNVETGELERLRARLADLEPVVAERDRLRIQLADVRHADSPGIVGGEIPEAPEPEHSTDDTDQVVDVAEIADVEDDAEIVDDAEIADVAEIVDVAEIADVRESRVLDLDAAARVIGKKVTLDDLTVVEGIGPKICELCSGIGITTWRTLADTDVADLQSMLDAAGSRYAVHKPGTWPRQAALLADGRWEEFRAVTTDDGAT